MKTSISIFLLFITLCSLTGCSSYMAAKQPAKKNLSVLDVGTSRSLVVAELGVPMLTDTKRNGQKYDVFSFKQGYSKGAKASRAFFHAGATAFTLGLWEIVGAPIESIADGKHIRLEILYDLDENVEKVTVLNPKQRKKSNDTMPAEKASSNNFANFDK